MANYDWTPGSRLTKYDPTEVHAWIERLRKQGPLTTDRVAEAARVKSSPAHKFFLWDDTEAAGRYRANQATQVLGQLRTVDGQRVYVVTGRNGKKNLWGQFDEAIHQQEFRKAEISHFYRDLNHLLDKYGFLAELQGQLKLLATLKPKLRKAAS